MRAFQRILVSWTPAGGRKRSGAAPPSVSALYLSVLARNCFQPSGSLPFVSNPLVSPVALGRKILKNSGMHHFNFLFLKPEANKRKHILGDKQLQETATLTLTSPGIRKMSSLPLTFFLFNLGLNWNATLPQHI